MPLADADYKWFHSTNLLGGVKTATPWQNAVKNDLFDNFTPAEATSGDEFYLGVYFENAHGTITMENIKHWISSITPSPDTEVAFGIALEGVNATMDTIADELTAPSPAVTFSAPTSQGAGLTHANLAPGDYIGIWFRLTIDALAAAKANDGWAITSNAEYTE